MPQKNWQKVNLIIKGQEIEFDRTVLDQIGDPLVHLLRNCVDHGIESSNKRLDAGKPETGTIKLIAAREKNNAVIEVSDDGAGIDPKEVKYSSIKKGIVTEDEAAKSLMQEYGKYLRNPYVTLKILNQRIFILGEVKTPGVVPVTNGTISLIEAIARSGDLTDFAERRGILILRGDLRDPEVRIIDLTHMSTIKIASLYLKPNDIVYVQPRSSKGRTIAYEEIAPPFRLISDILSPFVSITYLTEAWRD